ncbi:hypothetical protein HDU76_003078, partial [Blyttiomyces sp. JEL0837]
GGDGDSIGQNPTYISDGRYSIRKYTTESGWQQIGTLNKPRWYPTVVSLPDGIHYLIVGGHLASYVPNDLERRNPSMEVWPALPEGNGSVYLDILGDTYPYNSYPVVYVTPGNNVFVFASTKATLITLPTGLTSSTPQHHIPLPELTTPHLHPSHSFPYLSASVLLPLTLQNNHKATVMICGGTRLDNQATDTCNMIDPDDAVGGTAEWKSVERMPVPRVMGDAVLLPDGTVTFVNGAKWGTADGPAGYGMAKDPAFEAVVFNPEAPVGQRWKITPPATIPRLYHSSALLMSDGSIATFGSDQQNYDIVDLNPFEYRIEVYYPWYFNVNFRRNQIVESGGDVKLGYNSVLKVLVDDGVHDGRVVDEKVVLIRYSTSAHSTNSDSRFIELQIVNIDMINNPNNNTTNSTSTSHQQQQQRYQYTIRGPSNSSIAPPGNYFLFVVRDRVPSVRGITVLVA